MARKLPESMDNLVYFSRRKFGAKGSAVCWANRVPCPSCKKGLMSKPFDEKQKKFKTRAAEYVCAKCGYSEDKKDHEQRLTAEIMYTCPFCSKQGDLETPFKRKSFYGKPAIVFACASCGEKLGITKKLAMPEEFEKKFS